MAKVFKKISEVSEMTGLSISGIYATCEILGAKLQKKKDGDYVDLIEIRFFIEIEGIDSLEKLAKEECNS